MDQAHVPKRSGVSCHAVQAIICPIEVLQPFRQAKVKDFDLSIRIESYIIRLLCNNKMSVPFKTQKHTFEKNMLTEMLRGRGPRA